MPVRLLLPNWCFFAFIAAMIAAASAAVPDAYNRHGSEEDSAESNSVCGHPSVCRHTGFPAGGN